MAKEHGPYQHSWVIARVRTTKWPDVSKPDFISVIWACHCGAFQTTRKES